LSRSRTPGVAVSLFIAPDPRQIEAAATGCACRTSSCTRAPIASARGASAEAELRRLIEGARQAHRLGLRVNAGHGIKGEQAYSKTCRGFFACPISTR
jgi:pyridoxine 5-phosphate synthase